MPGRRSATPQPDAVSRRLSMLSAELAAVRTVSEAREEAPAQADEPHTRVRPLSVVSDTHTHVPTRRSPGS